ncbi:LytTR family transcriptional regulator DNA-binding domain-containing protein [Maribacter chungangensis]|uniref:LytTR family transcriptional regulator DNA-binding domain-containing protein n=1 Tax=Maribacter chungangensis TaxID=1069117 RepID=A0ABW3B225_9FLAO
MLRLIQKQIPYCSSFEKQSLIGLIIGGIIALIMILLQPFGTYSFESDYKYLIFSGFGLLAGTMYLFCARIENLWYHSKNKRWKGGYEIVSFIIFMLVSGIPIHFYNQVFLNNFFSHTFYPYEYLKHGIWFFGHSVVPVMLLLLPFYLYLRNKFGIIVTKKSLNEITLLGENNGEKLVIQKETLLFVKASENYVKIFYVKNNSIHHKTFRNTLAAIKEQVPFLHKSHRSYLVNIATIKTIRGNSQNAKIEFHLKDENIPLSKSYYKTIKLALGIKPTN